MEPDLLPLLAQTWDLPPDTPPTREALEAWLASQVHRLLTEDPERLINLLYRLDVSEEIADAAMESDAPAQALASAFVDRELKRLEFRRRYREEAAE